MGAGVATVGRRPYAAGLYWENSPSGRVSQAAKEAARQPGQQVDFYAVRGASKSGRIPQFGLGQASAGHRAGMPVLAACLANQQPGSWAGAFRLREGTVVMVVRDDLIVPDGDQFFVDETEARDRLLQEIGFGGLQRIYAPEAWGIPGADTMPLSLLLNDRADIRLRPVEIPRKLILFGAAGFALLLLVLGIGWYIQERNAQQEAERLAQLAALEKARQAAQSMLPQQLQGKHVEYPPPERKWEKKPPVMAVVEACRVALSQASAVVAGWQMGQVKCDGMSLTISWARLGGFSSPPEKATVNDSGTGATLSIPLPALTPRGAEDLVDPVEVTRRYLAQNWPGSINHAADDPPPPPPPGYQGEWTPPPPPWVKRSFQVTIPVLPWTLPTFFGDLPGTVVNSLSYSQGQSWTAEGVIYENRR